MRGFYWLLPLFLFVQCRQKDADLPHLQVSENKRFLVTEAGEPFFWMGDTGWLLFSKLDRDQAEVYLDNRANNGFNVIQVMLLHTLDCTNAYGDPALVRGNIAAPKVTEGADPEDELAYDYWDHVDYILDLAAQKGLYVAMVPVWGSNVKGDWVSVIQADAYATWLAHRYAKRTNVIWLIGGDTKGNKNKDVWNKLGSRIREHAPRQLITFHPFGRTRSSMWFHEAEWLDFNMFQSGHRRYDQENSDNGYGEDNWKYVAYDYALKPIKPTLDGEPSYESILQGLHDPLQPYWGANDVRRYAYWSVFAGAFGHTYGHNAIMQMHMPDDVSTSYGVREYWTEALEAEGAMEMKYLKRLMLSKPFLARVPDQSLIANGQGEKYAYLAATRGTDYAFIYTYTGREMNIAMGKITGKRVKASWYNPRNGESTRIGNYDNSGSITFDPPGEIRDGADWVLVLESIQ